MRKSRYVQPVVYGIERLFMLVCRYDVRKLRGIAFMKLSAAVIDPDADNVVCECAG
jgi:hypothetical protein